MQSRTMRRSGFTLLELLVVIGIIGILSGVMLTTFGGASESAQAARCMTNMRNLATAAHSCAMSDGYFPAAGSFAYRATNGIHERIGWISWIHPGFKTPYVSDKNGKYPRNSPATTAWRPILGYEQGNASSQARCYYAITNGSLWAHAKSFDSYVCPMHQKACKEGKIVPMWSYVMNSYFVCPNASYAVRGWGGRSFSGLTSNTSNHVPLGPEKVLLFAEVPFAKIPPSKGGVQNNISKADLLHDTASFDCTLRYNDSTGDTAESIGFNHKHGKRYVAHVAFADGHVAQLSLSPNVSQSQVKELTTWLCQGDEVTFDGRDYTRVSKADQKTK